MFCHQCEQTAKGTGCTLKGICGKEADVAGLQDLLVKALINIGVYGNACRAKGHKDFKTDHFLTQALFSTITNVNFDRPRLGAYIREACKIRDKFKSVCANDYPAGAIDADWQPADDLAGLIKQADSFTITKLPGDADTRSLREILLYGLKGMAAYADHAAIMGSYNEDVSSFFYKGLAAIADSSLNADRLIALIMEFGKANFRCMEMLDAAHTRILGNPVPAKVSLSTKKGPAIIVSGHDLPDLLELLRQTEGKHINIYTHGEMLPAHGYPELKKFAHLAGHFGTAWQNQQKEFNNIPAAILMTTNCIQKPADSYRDRIFTTGLVAWPNVTHISPIKDKKDFTPLINKALALKGFSADQSGKEITVGFAHNAVLSIAGKIIDAVKTGEIKHFFLIGGCDGAKPGRNYYTECAQKVPKNCVILTLACGKFRFNTLEFGDIGGIPRLLDCGQCNDAYSAIKIAMVLAEAFKCGVNDLPLSLILSWYEQKAVCILLTLLSLGVKNIRLGPSLPSFVSPNVLKILADSFNIQPITTPEQDIAAIMGK